MKLSRQLGLLILLVVPPCRGDASTFVRINIGDVRGAIIPKAHSEKLRSVFPEYTGFWTPLADDVKDLEKRLPAFLAAEANKNHDFKVEIRTINRRLSTYRRQYLGVVIKGKRKILVNCFPGPRASHRDEFPDWLKEYVRVSDGGTDFWNVVYDVVEHSLSQLVVHGEA